MDFHLKTQIPDNDLELDHTSTIILIGSCFSDEMTPHLEQNGFLVSGNPFGTLYHPSALANVLQDSLDRTDSVSSYQKDDVFVSWSSSGKVYGYSEKELKQKLVGLREELYAQLVKKDVLLIITFGSAWAYRHIDLDSIVGNCHKAPSDTFSKELSSVKEMLVQWKSVLKQLKEINPSLKVMFTVSPVRPKRDGLIENNRSKARLIELAHALSEKEYYYFPSYEIVVDELRDYQFYKQDRVHPSEEAVAYVWQSLAKTIFSEACLSLMKKVRGVKLNLAHRSHYAESKADHERIALAEKVKADLAKEHPEVKW